MAPAMLPARANARHVPAVARRPTLNRLVVAGAMLLTALTGGLAAAPAARAAGSAYASAVLADGPAGYWRLNERSGSNAWDSRHLHTGAYRNTPTLGLHSLLAAESSTTAVGFDGAADTVRITSAPSLSPAAALSVEAWIRPSVLPTAGHFASVVAKPESYALQFNGPQLEFTIIQNGVRRRLLAPWGAIVPYRTYHVVGTYNGTTQRLYINGRQVVSRAQTGRISVNTRGISIASWDGTRERFHGRIDEVAIYSKTLSSTQIVNHDKLGKGHTTTPSPTPTPTPPPSSGGGVKTGMAAHLMWQSLTETKADLDRMQAAGMTYVRFDVSWRNSEPTKGSYLYLDKLDQVISAVQAHGMALTMTVIETPSWANGGKGMFAPPTNMSDYARFMGVLAHRYAGRSGMVWEIWNEENDPHFWTTGPSASQYAGMLKAAYAAVKANDANATVLTGGILYNNTAFLQGLYAAGAGDSFDGLAIHPYAKGYSPSSTAEPYFSFKSSVPQFTSVLSGHGDAAKPIWITEMGWSTGSVSDATRATYLRDAVAIARTWTNVRGLGAYTLHQSQFATYGLLTTSGAATLSWTAYAAAQ
jgi:aryl-phospho-beta-D-glucosidase BglC (GH1 family)